MCNGTYAAYFVKQKLTSGEENYLVIIRVIQHGVSDGETTMTAQEGEYFYYKGTKYALIGYTGGELPTHHDFGINPSGETSSCWRGYTLTFGIHENQLVVKDLNLTSWSKEVIDGIRPIRRGRRTVYENINKSFDFTGYLLFGNDTAGFFYYFPDEYVKGASERYGNPLIYEVRVVNRNVISVTNWSEQLLERRQRFLPEKYLEIVEAQKHLKTGSAESLQTAWDYMTLFLPRRYDCLQGLAGYNNYPYAIKRLRDKT